MKKMILTLIVALLALNLPAQTMAFTAIEVKAKPFTQKDISESFDKVFEGVEMNNGGVVLERFIAGRRDGMTHRIVFLYTLGEELMDEDAISPDKNAVFWGKMRNYVEEWGNSYSGRMKSWKEGDTEKMPLVHIWNISPENPAAFKKGHDKIVDEFADDFKDRIVGFGTYDIGMPEGASHWIAVTGEDGEDHLMLYDKLENEKKFVEFAQERGSFEIIKDFSVRILKRK